MGRIKGAQAHSSGAEWCSVSRLPHTLARSMLLQLHKLPHNYPEGTQREERQARRGESERGKSRTGCRAYCHRRVQGPGPDVGLQAPGTQMMAASQRLSPINEKHSHLKAKVSSVANIICQRPLLTVLQHHTLLFCLSPHDSPNAMPTRCLCYLPVLMSAVRQRHFRYQLEKLQKTEVCLGAKERTESSFASPPYVRRRVQLSFLKRFEIFGVDSLELNREKYQGYIYGSEICCWHFCLFNKPQKEHQI